LLRPQFSNAAGFRNRSCFFCFFFKHFFGTGWYLVSFFQFYFNETDLFDKMYTSSLNFFDVSLIY